MAVLNPVLLTERSTQKLPRPLLGLMLIAYIVCGILGKTPWRGNDAMAFGMALSFSKHFGLDSLQMIANAQVAEYGPIWFAIIGLFIRYLPFLSASTAAAIPVILSLLFGIYAIWKAIFYLAKTKTAQPLTLALGGQPTALSYATAVADGGVLLLLATLGIAMPLHEMGVFSFQFTLLSGLLAGLSLSLHPERVHKSNRIVSICLILLGSSVGLHTSISIGIWLLLLIQMPAWKHLKHALIIFSISLVLGLLLPFLWAYSLNQLDYIHALWTWNIDQFGWINRSRLKWLLSNIGFITWPVLPFALAALWRWHKHWQMAHIGLGLSFIATILLNLLTQNHPSPEHLIAIIPGALILAAFLLPALPCMWMNPIDWFGIMALSIAIALCWLMWIAMNFGFPSSLSHNIMRLTPHFNIEILWFNVCIASIATVLWILIVRWRTLSDKTVIWRAAVIWSGGSLTVWILIGTLFMPWLNHVKSYQPLALSLKTALNTLNISSNENKCIRLLNVGLPQRAILAYFGEFNFERQGFLKNPQINLQFDQPFINIPHTVQCDWILEYVTVNPKTKPFSPYLKDPSQSPIGTWNLRWEGRRFIEKEERFRLYQRYKTPINTLMIH